nr:hypothetical protein [uncultured Clostridium sp.]
MWDGKILFNGGQKKVGGEDGYYISEFGGVVNRLSIHVGPFKTIRLTMFGQTSYQGYNYAARVWVDLLRANKSLIRSPEQTIDGDGVVNIDVSDINEYVFIGIRGEGTRTKDKPELMWISRIDFLN